MGSGGPLIKRQSCVQSKSGSDFDRTQGDASSGTLVNEKKMIRGLKTRFCSAGIEKMLCGGKTCLLPEGIEKIANGEGTIFPLIGATVCRFEIIVQRYRSWALPEENPKSLTLFGFSSGDAPELAARPTLHAGDVVQNCLFLPRMDFGSGARGERAGAWYSAVMSPRDAAEPVQYFL